MRVVVTLKMKRTQENNIINTKDIVKSRWQKWDLPHLRFEPP